MEERSEYSLVLIFRQGRNCFRVLENDNPLQEKSLCEYSVLFEVRAGEASGKEYRHFSAEEC